MPGWQLPQLLQQYLALQPVLQAQQRAQAQQQLLLAPLVASLQSATGAAAAAAAEQPWQLLQRQHAAILPPLQLLRLLLWPLLVLLAPASC